MAWQHIGNLKGPPGDSGSDGREVELRVTGTHVQWRLVGDVAWVSLVALSAITGPAGSDGQDGINGADGADGTDGLSVELQTTTTHVQWRQAAGGWTNLVLLADITGPQGEPGPQGVPGPPGPANLVIGPTEPPLSPGQSVLWLDTTDGDLTLNLVTGD